MSEMKLSDCAGGVAPCVFEDSAAVEKVEKVESITLDSIMHRALPKLPRLPKSFELLLGSVPAPYREAAMIAMLPCLGTVGTGLRFRYLDGQLHSPSFISAIVGKSGAGKSFIRFPKDVILTPIRDQDKHAQAQENAYKLARQQAKNKQQQPNIPQCAIRIQPLNITVANLAKHMYYAKDRHLFSFGEEIDTLSKAEKVSWGAKKDILRNAFDNGEAGISNATENSLNIYQPVYYNLLVCGTPVCTFRFFDNIEDGLVSRVCFAQIPSEFAADMPYYKDYTEEDKTYIVEVMRKLMVRSGEMKNKSVYAAAKRWNAKTQQWAKQTGSFAIDHYRRRACCMGFRAGMLFAALDEIEGTQGTGCGAKVMEWVADYCFTMHLRLFGNRFEEQTREDDKRMQGLFTKSLIHKSKSQESYESLPQTFTKDDVIQLRLKVGKSTQADAIRMLLNRWKKAGKIVEVEPNKYVKQ